MTMTGSPARGTHQGIPPLVPRSSFPLLDRSDREGRPIAYLDSAASAQKPRVVLERLRLFYETGYANIHRGVYPLSETATEAYEGARATVADFLGARGFLRDTTPLG